MCDSFRYVERFIQPGDSVSEECKRHLTRKPVFLPRGIRTYNKSPFGKKQVEKIRLAAEAGATRKEMIEQARRDQEEEEAAQNGGKDKNTERSAE